MKKIISAVIIILVWIGSLFRSRYYYPEVIVNTNTVTDTVWKDTTITKYIPKPYPVYIDTSRVDTVYIPSDDSLLIVMYKNLHQQYFSTYNYSDTIKNDSLAFIQIDAKITQNKPILYKETYFDRKPSIINGRQITPRNKSYEKGIRN